MVKSYGDIETDFIAKDIQACRKIVNEIHKFGVNQDQILQLIYFLSLELENRQHMLEISNLIKDLKSNLSTEENKSTLLEI
jgi:hypothetical protein